MILKYLKNNHSYLIILFVFFCFLFFSTSIFTIEFKKIKGLIPYYSFLLLFSCFFITFLHSVWLNKLVYEKDVIKKRNFIIAFVFLLLNTTFVTNLKMVLISFGLLLFLYYLLSLHKQKQPYALVFNAGIVLSILSFYIPSILLFHSVILFSCIVFRNISWRVFVLAILSIFVTYVFVWTYQITFDLNLYLPKFNFSYRHISLSFFDLYLHQKIWWGMLSLIILLSFYELLRWMYKKSNKSRESFIIILFYLFIGIITCLISQNNESISFLLVPLSIIISNFFVYYKKEKISELIFLLFLLSSIFYRISMINM